MDLAGGPRPYARRQLARCLQLSPEELDRLLAEGAGEGSLREATEPVASAGTLSFDDEEHLVLAGNGPGRHGPGVIDALAAMLAAQRRADDLLGSGPLLAPVIAQLAVVEALVTEARGDVHTSLLDLAGQWAQFAGWLSENTGQAGQATRLYGQALGYAVEAGNIDLAAEVTSLKGHLAWNMGRMESVIVLSQAAQRDPRAFPGQHAISAAQEARVHAILGDADATDRKLADAMRLAALAAQRPEDAPPWLYYHSQAFFTLQRGRAYRYLGRADRARNRRAIEELTRGLGELPGDQRQADWAGEYVRQLVIAHVQAGGIDEACALARDVVAIARRTSSTGLLASIDRLHARLAGRWPKEPAVIGLGDVLRSGQSPPETE